MRLPFIANPKILTAQTDGRKMEYNPDFLSRMSPGQRNFVLMHEMFHVILFHCKRRKGDPQLWNTATDIVVNDMLKRLTAYMRQANIPFESPDVGVFAAVQTGETVENVYDRLLAENGDRPANSRKVRLKRWAWEQNPAIIDAPDEERLAFPGDSAGRGAGRKEHHPAAR